MITNDEDVKLSTDTMSTMTTVEQSGRSGRRMSGTERREQVLAAAARAFADGGYAGTSTDQVARAAGVSQPYVVRMFGTKHELFREVFASVTGRVVETMRTASRAGDDPLAAMADAYGGLLADRDLLLVMMHGFVAGADPEIGALARETLLEVYRIARDVPGGSPEKAREFLANGMLINVMVATGMPERLADGGDVLELARCTFGADAEELVAATGSDGRTGR